MLRRCIRRCSSVHISLHLAAPNRHNESSVPQARNDLLGQALSISPDRKQGPGQSGGGVEVMFVASTTTRAPIPIIRYFSFLVSRGGQLGVHRSLSGDTYAYRRRKNPLTTPGFGRMPQSFIGRSLLP